MRIALLLALAVAPVFAASYSFELKPEITSIQFTVPDPLHTVHGTFRLAHGKIEFDDTTGKATGQVVVDVTSGNSGSEARDSRMHAHLLESKMYPEATFAPDHVDGKISIPGTSNVKVHGTFTLHGAPHEMTMDVQTSASPDHQMKTTMTFDIPYVAWGMKDPSNFLLKVGKTVKMTIEASGIITLK